MSTKRTQSNEEGKNRRNNIWVAIIPALAGIIIAVLSLYSSGSKKQIKNETHGHEGVEYSATEKEEIIFFISKLDSISNSSKINQDSKRRVNYLIDRIKKNPTITYDQIYKEYEEILLLDEFLNSRKIEK